MSDGNSVDENEQNLVRVDSVEDVSRHTGDEVCAYCKEDGADYDVTMRRSGKEGTFAACHGCAYDNGVRPGDWDL